ncbi:MutH/Sau3AI family endonuclease [Spiroplasma tabanidicola]|uniref:DNA mismatch repair MutH/Type II restriction enzyme Sau3AI domain-containing protein n=1 Tax=Spiroplasma tabanidicola TaxID=324079 RepID=A0A6I6CAA9_9MOLU|nr:MutH/Sau3AI family endonuclease [Spiroplasma tabanidicola]QGS51851.1 hypothetical protein STABA_v1c04880 [Spiroplasma tabanidicola]
MNNDQSNKLLKIQEILDKARKIIGIKFKDLWDIDFNQKDKGSIGNLIQEKLFNISRNSKKEPDFLDLNIELKVIPVKQTDLANETKTHIYKINNKKYKVAPKERMVLNLINYEILDKETKFEESSLFLKNKITLVIVYLHDFNLPKEEWFVIDAFIYNIKQNEQYEIIKKDWEIIKNKVNDGLAHELSEKDTDLLAACTKGSSANSVRNQPHNKILAKQRAFSFKIPFINSLITQYRDQKEIFELFSEYKKEYKVAYDYNEVISELKKLIGTDLSNYGNWNAFGKSPHRNAFKEYLKLNNNLLFDYLISTDYKIVCKVLKNNKIQEEIGAQHDLNIYDTINNNFYDSEFYSKVVLFKYIVIGINKENKTIESIYEYSFSNDDIETLEKVYELTKDEILRIMNLDQSDRIKPNFIQKGDDLLVHLRPHASKGINVYNKSSLNITRQTWWINKNLFKKIK